MSPLEQLLARLMREAECGHTVVTPTRRLARAITQQLNDAFVASGKTVWSTPDVLPWTAFIERCFDQAVSADDDPPLLLSRVQSNALWEQVVGNDLRQDQPHVSARLIARSASNARQLLFDWKIPASSKAASDLDVKRFQTWHQRYKQALEKHHWLDHAAAIDVISRRLDGASLQRTPPAQLFAVGFDLFTPQQEVFLAHWQTLQNVAIIAPGERNESVQSVACFDTLEEFDRAARWARQCCEDILRRGATDQPIDQPIDQSFRVAIIVPDIAKHRDTLERLMMSVIDSAQVGFTRSKASGFHISLGPALSDQPVVAAALLALQLLRTSIDMQTLGALLRSAYIHGGCSELPARAILDAHLRRLGLLELPVQEVATLSALDRHSAPGFSQLVSDVFALDVPKRATAVEWAQLFQRLLHTAGWPGERSVDSTEYQAVQSWRESLQQFSSTSAVHKKLSLNAALASLTALLCERAFAPKAPAIAIDVLGLTEASGLEFTHAWLCGMNDHVWPPPPVANAFVGFQQQRRAGVPQANPAAMRDYATRVFDRIVSSTTHLIVSHAQWDEDSPLRPSMLTKGLSSADEDSVGVSDVVPRAEQIFAHKPKALHIERDEQLPALNPGLEVGGTGLFKAQSQCSFQAAARYRLNVTPLEPLTGGLTPLERGSFVHRVMEVVWTSIDTHAALIAMDERALHDTVNRALDQVFKEKQQDRRYTPTVQQLERLRLTHSIVQLLKHESDRPAFTVSALEEKYQATVGGITFTYRPDRIDQISATEKLVIDYKTGDVSLSDWAADRLFDPQLPLYALVLDESVNALSFVSLKSGNVRFVGLCEDAKPADGIHPIAKYNRQADLKGIDDWSSLRQYWRGKVEQLGASFLAGDARVDPINKRVCGYCDYQPLCRIDDAIEAPVEEPEQ